MSLRELVHIHSFIFEFAVQSDALSQTQWTTACQYMGLAHPSGWGSSSPWRSLSARLWNHYRRVSFVAPDATGINAVTRLQTRRSAVQA
ncbi:MAG: hypothetical protein C0434_10775 [Xanthomonadaceae bacterium]|nr:hypothetical protein [Xanthomonadaceae bacterium]